MDVLRSFFLLLLAQAAGETLHRLLRLPLPGPVLGMALLAAVLLLRKREPDAALVQTSESLLRWLGLLFVPVGVGVFSYIGVFVSGWLPIFASLVVSTLLTFAATAWTMQVLQRRTGRANAERAA